MVPMGSLLLRHSRVLGMGRSKGKQANNLKYELHSIIAAMVTSNIDGFLVLQYSEPVCKE